MIIQDITERKLVEEKLRESERLYRTLAESSPDIIFIVGRDTSVQYMNRSGLEHFRLTPELIAGKRAPDLFPPEMMKSLAAPLSTVFQIIYNQKPAIEFVFNDITERKRSEEALRESEARFRQAMEVTRDGVWETNVKTGEAYYSPAYYKMLGYEPDESEQANFAGGFESPAPRIESTDHF